MTSRIILLRSEENFMSTSLPTLCGSMAAHPYRMAVEVHNAAYRALGIDYTFVYFGISNPEEGVKAIRALGFSPTMTSRIDASLRIGPEGLDNHPCTLVQSLVSEIDVIQLT